MLRCTHCRGILSLGDSVCSDCGNPSAEEIDTGSHDDHMGMAALSEFTEAGSPDAATDGPLEIIARFGSAAEAGYFAHELLHTEAIPVRLTSDESFDALRGFWSTRYVLAVPVDKATSAKLALSDLVEATRNDDGFESHETGSLAATPEPPTKYSQARSQGFDDPEIFDRDRYDDRGVNWVPIVLTLTAGSLAFWVARKAQEPPPERPPVGQQDADLWDTLTNEPAPWYQPINGGRGIRELSIDRQHNQAILREDLDGDGVFETRRTIAR